MDIVDKIQKLLALAQSSNPNEAALAAARAQELMIKYAVEEADLNKNRIGVVPNEAIETEALELGYKSLPHWQIHLANALSKSFFCRVFYRRGRDCFVVGRKSDREVLKATFRALKSDIERLADKAWNAKPKDFGIHGRTWKVGFYEGAVKTISERLEANILKLKADNAGTAIVLVNRQKDVDDFLAKNYKLGNGGARRTINPTGYQEGRVAGQALNLSKREVHKELAK